MTTPASMKIDLPGIDFEGMAREAIAAKLTEAFTSSDAVITKIIAGALAQKVNERGQVDRSNDYYNRTPYIEWLVGETVRKVTLEVLAKQVESMRPELEKQIEKQLKKSVTPAAKALAETFVKNASAGYYTKIDMQFCVNKE